jgi:arylsulfatase A-like enzyme
MDVILITIDCLRSDCTYQIEENQVFAPNLAKILEDSLYFPNAITNGPGTRFAFPAIMMSKLPGEIEGVGLPKDGGITLAEYFQNLGYATIGIHSNGWLSKDFNYHRGFDYFFDPINWAKKEHTRKQKIKKSTRKIKWLYSAARRFKNIVAPFNINYIFGYKFAEEVNSHLYEVIAENDLTNRKKFIWLHYMDAHHPYFVHKEYVKFYPKLSSVDQKHILALLRHTKDNISRLKDNEMILLQEMYKSEISYIDASIGDLKEHFPNAVFIITSDHGEEFGEHGHFHSPNFYKEMINIPLILNGIDTKGASLALISHVDLAPFLSLRLGHKPDRSWSGSSDVEKIKFQFSGYVEGNRKVLSILDRKNKLAEKDDDIIFCDRDDKVADDQTAKKELQRELTDFKRTIEKRKMSISAPEISDEVKHQLRSLGYFD